MPSNENLTENIISEATTKGIALPDTDGKNNAQLAEILKNLKTLVSTPAPAPAPAPDILDNTDDNYEYYVADGKALTSKKGLLAEGDEVKESYLSGGITRIKELIKSGVILKG